VLGAKSSPYRAAKAAGLLERGFHRGVMSWLTPSLGQVEKLKPVDMAPPDLRDEMCGPHRKRPAAEEADDETSEDPQMLSSLPPSSGKASTLLKEKPGAVKAIAVFVGAAKKAAETQFAEARAKISKIAKGRTGKNEAMMRDPHTAPLPDDQTPAATASTAAPAASVTPATAVAAKPQVLPPQAPAPALQTASSPPAGAFTPPPSQPGRMARTMPGTADVYNPSLMSFASPNKTDPAPLTATPDARATVDVPLPRPRPKIAVAARHAAPQPAAAHPATAAAPAPIRR
jgi:D-alanyl-D-alanine carboxypeptidase